MIKQFLTELIWIIQLFFVYYGIFNEREVRVKS